jgi:quercetin 2,3-dioxygenase
LDSWHSFNFNGQYRPEDSGHGLLVVNNDDVVAAGAGFGTHGHRDMEIVTWVLSGELAHADSAGNQGVLHPGLAQRMSAGSGIRHSEMNPNPDAPGHFVQMWVRPDTLGVTPCYEQLDVNEQLSAGGLVPVASGKGHCDTVFIHQRDAVLYAGRLVAGETVSLPVDVHVHVFAALGSVTLESGEMLEQGAAARLTNVEELHATAGADGAELLVWATA